MTTYAPNFTPRTRVKYVAAGIEHTIQMRSPRGTGSGVVSGKAEIISDLFDLFSDILADDFAWVSAEYALTDSDVFIPFATPTVVSGTVDPTTFSLHQRVTSTNFNGKAAGSRAAVYMYGLFWSRDSGTPADNGRVTPAENADVGTAAGILSSNAVAGSGDGAFFHNYANIKVNDHLLKLLRRGTIA